jgi:hypothetical protein
MGNWTLESARPDVRDRNDVFGNYFALRFRLKYSPSSFGLFSEMPRLEWKETITMIEKKKGEKGEWWQYVGDQFARDPNSQTFMSWVGRYNYAHFAVRQGRYGPDETVRLFDKNGGQLPRDTFPSLNDRPKEQADAVRNYLKQHGGIMDVMVVDKPGINKPTETSVHKERILTFDCGLQNSGVRVHACQHLVVDGSVPEGQWKRECVLQMVSPPFQTTGLRRMDPPPDVTIVKPFTGGAHSGTYL